MDDKELRKGKLIHFKKREFIIRQGEPANYIYYLFKGLCARTCITVKGDDIIYDTRLADGSVYCLLGALALYSSPAIHSTNFVAKTDCICYKINNTDFRAFLRTYPEVLEDLMHVAVNRYDNLEKNFHSKHKGCIANRVCSFVVENLEEKNNALWLEKRFNHTEIGRYLGVHRVTVYRILKKLQTDGIIHFSPEGLQILDVNRILVYARDEEILNYHQQSH